MKWVSTRTDRQLRWLLAAALAVMALAPAVGFAGDRDAAKREYWQNKYAQLIMRASSAESLLASSRLAYRKSRQRDWPRGRAREQLLLDLKAAEAEFEIASKQLTGFPEEARQAGVLPGWLREVEDRKTP